MLPLTWHRHKELDSISVAMETELSVGHGAVGHEGAGSGAVRTLVSIETDGAAGPARGATG